MDKFTCLKMSLLEIAYTAISQDCENLKGGLVNQPMNVAKSSCLKGVPLCEEFSSGP